MERVLSDLNKVPGIQGSLVVGNDGIVIISDLSDEINEDEISALASSLILTAGKICQKLEQGPLNTLLVETNTTKWYIQHLNIGYLVAIAEGESNLGLIRVEMRDATVKLNNLALNA